MIRMNKNKQLLKDVAYKKIKEKIITEDDEYTSENQLVEELQMSRTPIREALQRLQHEGFIRILPNQGISIPDLSVKETNDILDFRIAIETASVRQAVDLVQEKDFEHLNQLIEQQTEAVNQNNVLLYLQHDVDFHMYLLNVVGNDMFIQANEHLCLRLYRIRRRIKSNPQVLYTRIKEHIQIMDFLKNKQTELAVAELERHLKSNKIPF